MKTVIKSVTILSFLALLASCSGEKSKTVESAPPIAATIHETANSQTSRYITASGKIEAENSANVSTRMMGYVTSLKVKTGQGVSKGQLLATINSADIQAKKAQAEAGILQATAAYNNAEKDFARFVTLFNQKSVSQKEMDDMTTRFEMAKAGLEAARQMKNEVMAQFSYTNITAPFSGTVTGTFIKEGDMANPGYPLLSLEGNTSLQATVMVSESEISGIRNGMIADILVKSIDKSLKGEVVEVSSSARNTGGQYIVKIDLENGDGLILSGMFVHAVFPGEPQNTTVLISKKALVTQGQLKGVYAVTENNVATLRWLRLGKSYGDQIEVLSGLSAGEKYVVEARSKLYNGAKVTPLIAEGGH